jgi:hypothetical protein
MGVHVVFSGPSTAGKTALMVGLSQLEGMSHEFHIDKAWTTRQRRLGENNAENIFVNQQAFDERRSRFLFTFFSAYGDFEYGIDKPTMLGRREVRMRILQPSLARRFRREVPEPTVLCSISPFSIDPEGIIRRRQPDIPLAEVEARVNSFFEDDEVARHESDIHFNNRLGLQSAVVSLGALIVSHLAERDL